MITKLSDFVIETNGTTISTISTDRILCIVGKDEITDVLSPENTVLISILEPGADPLPIDVYNRYSDHLKTWFWDVTELQMIEIESYQQKSVPCITFEQANEIKEFILKNKDKKFAVHCSAGISRSAGVANAILCLLDCNGDVYDFQTGYDNPIKKHWRYMPNKTVFDRIVES